MAEKKKLTPAERKQVEDQIAALQASLHEEAEAPTPEEEEAAAAEVEEQKEKLAALFDRLGLTEEDYDLLAGALAAGTEERTRKIVREELAAEMEAEENDDGSLKGAGAAGGRAKPAKPPKGEEAPAEGDNPPPSKHWTEKKLFGKKEEEAAS